MVFKRFFREIEVEDDIRKKNIKFEIRKIEIEDWKIELFPGINDKVVKNKLPLAYAFSVYCESGMAFYHEGHIIVDIDKRDLEIMKEVFQSTIIDWNKWEGYKKNKDIPSNRGYIHQLGFDKWEENKAYFYIDAGTSGNGVYEFLLKNIAESGINVKSVEIIEYIDY